MNRHAPFSTQRPATTMAAETMPRRAWTVAEVEAMQAAGIISEDERFEMIGGEVVPKSAKGARHEWVKIELNLHLQRTLSNAYRAAQETTLRLDEHGFVEPDFCIYSATNRPVSIAAADVLLVIEIAESSLRYDTGRKLDIYAAHGIPEVWVVDARTLETRTWRDRTSEGYRSHGLFGAAQSVSAERLPLSVTLSDLGLTPVENQ